MDPLKRNNPGVARTEHENRIQALERRIFRTGLRWASMTSDNAGNQTVTATTEMIWGGSSTNAPDLFAWDPSDPAGLLIKENGIFACFATINVLGASIGVSRAIYQAVCQLSQGPGACVGVQLGEGSFFLGTGQGSSSIAEVTTIAKSTLSHIAVVYIRADRLGPNDPARHVVFLQHNGVNYTVGNILSSAWVVELADYEFDDTPAP